MSSDALASQCPFLHGTHVDAGALGRALARSGRHAVAIGEVLDSPRATVVLATGFGGERVVDVLTGDQLPRIC